MTVSVTGGSGGGSSTFLGLTDVSATSIVDGQCVAGAGGMLTFQACGGGGYSVWNSAVGNVGPNGMDRIAFGSQLTGNPNSYITAGGLLDDLFQVSQSRTQPTQIDDNDQFWMWDVGATTVREVPWTLFVSELAGSTSTANPIYYAHMADITVGSTTDNTDNLEGPNGTMWTDFTSGLTETINVGSFTVETEGTPARSKVVVQLRPEPTRSRDFCTGISARTRRAATVAGWTRASDSTAAAR